MLKRLAVVLVLLTIGFAQPAPPTNFDGNAWWDYVKYLASDDLEGRETGSEGLRRAAAYIVDDLKKNGLQPAGSEGFYQTVKFRSKQVDESTSSIALERDGKSEPLVVGEDAILGSRIDGTITVDAPLVFVGYGLRVPEMKYDDFAGQDLKGKVAVMISGSVSDMPAALAAHYRSTAEMRKALKDAGAIGTIGIPNPASMDIPWSRMVLSRTRPSMVLADTALNDSAGMKFAATINPAHADKLFEGTGHTFAELAALAKDRKPLPRFALPVKVKAKVTLIEKDVESANVVAKYPSSDPKLKDEYVVLSAHMDHIGVGEPINGDRIYNGAMDNASGSALLLDIAAHMAQSKTKTRRSVLFVFVTAEEKGLLGSRYFAAKPTVPKESIIADVNTDMFLPIFPLKTLTVYGLAESDLGDTARKAAEREKVAVQADPEPLRNLFIRSDQYSFIREGVPSIAMKVGFEKGSPEEKQAGEWLKTRYHAPSDDINQPVNLAAAGKFESIVHDITIDVANAQNAPQWKSDSFFRRFAKTTGTK